MGELNTEAIRNRDITLNHYIAGFLTDESVFGGAALDTLREVIKRIFINPPSDLTDEQKTAFIDAVGAHTSDLNEQQVRNIVGALLATLSQFSYDENTGVLTFKGSTEVIDQIARNEARQAQGTADGAVRIGQVTQTKADDNAREIEDEVGKLEATDAALSNRIAAITRLWSWGRLVGEGDKLKILAQDIQSEQPFIVHPDNGLPGITGADDLDGNYVAVFDADKFNISAASQENIDGLEIAIVDADGASTLVHRANWAYRVGRQVVNFNIDVSEESAARANLINGRYRFLIAANDGANRIGDIQIYDLPVSAQFISSSADQTARNAAAAADRKATDAGTLAIEAKNIADAALPRNEAQIVATLIPDPIHRSRISSTLSYHIHAQLPANVVPDSVTKIRGVLHGIVGASSAFDRTQATDRIIQVSFNQRTADRLFLIGQRTINFQLEFLDAADNVVFRSIPPGNAVISDEPIGSIINATIDDYDADQDRFEDSADEHVHLVAGTTYVLTQAVYDKAVADSFAFPAGVIFLTSAS